MYIFTIYKYFIKVIDDIINQIFLCTQWLSKFLSHFCISGIRLMKEVILNEPLIFLDR